MLYRFADFALDTDRRELRRGAQPVAIAPQVFDLLECLIKNRHRVVNKDDLIAAVWDGRIVSESAVSTRINAVRCAINDTGEDQRLIRTIPRRGVRFVGIVHEAEEPQTPAAADAIEQPRPTLALPDRPSIAVLPFTNMSDDLQQDYFADGMAEEITTALSRLRWLFVIARNSSFTYKGGTPTGGMSAPARLEALLRAAALCCIPGARCTLRRGEAEIARKPPSRMAQPLRDRVRPAQPTSTRHNQRRPGTIPTGPPRNSGCPNSENPLAQ